MFLDVNSAYCHTLMFYYNNGGMFCVNIHISSQENSSRLLSLEIIPLYENAVDVGQKCINKL